MDYSINELAAATGVGARTIYYYTEQGLLAPPRRNGRSFLYSQEHAHRLAAIRELQGEGLSLKEIDARLGALTGSDAGAVGPGPARPRSVARRGLFDMDRLTPKQRRASRSRALRDDAALWSPLASMTAMAGQGSKPQASSGFDVWRRVSITPDIELHVRGRSARTIYRLERALWSIMGDELSEGTEKGTEEDDDGQGQE